MLVFTFATPSEIIDINLNSLENSYFVIEELSQIKIHELESNSNMDGLKEYKKYSEQIKRSLVEPKKIKKPSRSN
jgi:D-hexose-6-phosphate mutarotase|tara:strand:+ start:1076 stop:1300 length:225 start_codon:yes stop_codon:yes gene_type:complete